MKLFGELSKAKKEVDVDPFTFISSPDVNLKGYLLGATVPVGPGLIRVAYSAVKYDNNTPARLFGLDHPKANKFAIGYVHNLSKRTALYATVARIRNKDGAALALGGPSFVAATTQLPGQAFVPKTSTGLRLRHPSAF